jgi:hypothetical protein
VHPAAAALAAARRLRPGRDLRAHRHSHAPLRRVMSLCPFGSDVIVPLRRVTSLCPFGSTADASLPRRYGSGGSVQSATVSVARSLPCRCAPDLCCGHLTWACNRRHWQRNPRHRHTLWMRYGNLPYGVGRPALPARRTAGLSGARVEHSALPEPDQSASPGDACRPVRRPQHPPPPPARAHTHTHANARASTMVVRSVHQLPRIAGLCLRIGHRRARPPPGTGRRRSVRWAARSS